MVSTTPSAAAAAAAAAATSGGVRDVRLYSQLPIHQRLDVFPFAVLHAVLAGVAKRAASDAFEATLIVGAGVLLHALAHLATQWSAGALPCVCQREEITRSIQWNGARCGCLSA